MKHEYKVNSLAPYPMLGRMQRLRLRCGQCYQTILNRLAAVKARLEGEFGRTMAGYEQLLKATINEAEALAWQTPYPHLLFPALAEEKAAAAQQWVAHQQAIREESRAGRYLQLGMVR